MEQLNNIMLIVGILLCCSIFASRLSSIMGLPVLLLFLVLGMICGEHGFILHISFNNYSMAYYVANLALAVIIFDGGCQTSFFTFKTCSKPAVILSTLGVFITTIIVGCAAYYLFKLPFFESMLVGCIIGSTDAGAVFSLLGDNGVSLKNKVQGPLEIESATNDPMAIFLTITVMEIIKSSVGTDDAGGGFPFANALIFFIKQFSFGIVAGIIFGYLGRTLLNVISIPNGLYSLLVLGVALTGFAVTSIVDGSGFLAIFIIGMIIGNTNIRQLNYIRPVQDGYTWLSQICLFLMLGLLVNPPDLVQHSVNGLIIAAIMAFVARPIAVFLCLKPLFKFTTSELLFMSWVGLRGSVPIVLAIYPIMNDIPHGDIFFNIAFVVVIFSLLVQGATILPVAKFFDVYAPSSTTPVSKGQMGIAIDDDYEIFNYEIKHKAFHNVLLSDIKFPNRTMIASIFRTGQVIHPVSKLRLKKGDIISIIGHSDDELLLNAIFNGETPIRKNHYQYFGDILLSGELNMTEVAEKYGLIITSRESELTLADFMSYHLGGIPTVGERLTIIDCRFTVCEVFGAQIVKVGYEKLDDII
jgi:cell volume regulation protein A